MTIGIHATGQLALDSAQHTYENMAVQHASQKQEDAERLEEMDYAALSHEHDCASEAGDWAWMRIVSERMREIEGAARQALISIFRSQCTTSGMIPVAVGRGWTYGRIYDYLMEDMNTSAGTVDGVHMLLNSGGVQAVMKRRAFEYASEHAEALLRAGWDPIDPANPVGGFSAITHQP